MYDTERVWENWRSVLSLFSSCVCVCWGIGVGCQQRHCETHTHINICRISIFRVYNIIVANVIAEGEREGERRSDLTTKAHLDFVMG